ncbi:MAG: hypothetical protein HXX13_02570 [Bacteroidetes bacterium]|nr:hypothetical protein [Bacteroidota bacterium]
MKINNKSSIILLSLTFYFLINLSGYSQKEPNSNIKFQISIRNISKASENSLEFDLFLLNLDKNTPLELALFQAGIRVNPEIYNGGNITASIVTGSSELIEAQQPQIVIFSQSENTIKLPSRLMKTPHSTPGSGPRGSIISSKESGTRICRIKLDNTQAFKKTKEIFSFSFDKLPYCTSVYQYVNGMNTPMRCNADNCIVKP